MSELIKKSILKTKNNDNLIEEIDSRVQKILFNSQQIKIGIQNAAKWINENYQNKKPILIAILKGAMPFYGQLVTQIKTDVILDFMVVSSFKGGVYAISEPEIITDLITDVKNKDLLLIEDVVDTARTMNQVINLLQKRGAKSIRLVTLVDKPNSRKVPLRVDYACFTIGAEFIVGFGLDYKEYLRNLPYIGTLKKEIYKNKKE